MFRMKSVLPFLILFFWAAVLPGAAKRSEMSDRELHRLSRLTVNILKENHYRGDELNLQAISQKLFEEYFKRLDPGRIFFTQEDIQRFQPFKQEMEQHLKRGDIRFALEVYALYRERQHEFRRFAENFLKENLDFSVDEDFRTDTAKQPFVKDRKELTRQWEKRLKNDVLYYRLLNRALEENAAEKRQKASTDQNELHEQQVEKAWKPKSPETRLLQRLRDLSNEIDQKDKQEIVGIYLDTLCQLYGPHSNYMPPALDEDFEINMRLSLTGIGATLSCEDGYIKVVSLVPGGPAARQGKLQVGDRITAVTQQDGTTTDVIDMPVSKAVKFIRGPVDTKVTLTVLPGEKGPAAAPEEITITRAKVQLVDSAAKGTIQKLPRQGGELKIGVIEVPGFYGDFQAAERGETDFRSCANDVRRILDDFKRQHVDAVVMDMRRNGGGYLVEAIRLTGLFIPVGPVVQVQSSNREVELQKDLDPSISYAGPLVILNSKLSASSSEIFAGAIRDLDRGVLAGDSRTFGKGTVLNVYPLDRWVKKGGTITFETAMFFRPGGGSVQQLGIEPDVVIPSLTEELEVGEMFMDNHLPWNSINPVPHVPFDAKLGIKTEELRKRSAARIKNSGEFRQLLRRTQLIRKYRARKTVSLNEAKRWAEYKSEKAFQEETDQLFKEPDKKKAKAKDPVLGEAVAIAADLAELSR